MGACGGFDFAAGGFWLDVVIAVASAPLAYLTWASGTMSLLVTQARKRGWVNRTPPNENENASNEWERQFGG